jgi:hypothetical protein
MPHIILQAWSAGDRAAEERLWPMVFAEPKNRLCRRQWIIASDNSIVAARFTDGLNACRQFLKSIAAEMVAHPDRDAGRAGPQSFGRFVAASAARARIR